MIAIAYLRKQIPPHPSKLLSGLLVRQGVWLWHLRYRSGARRATPVCTNAQVYYFPETFDMLTYVEE